MCQRTACMSVPVTLHYLQTHTHTQVVGFMILKNVASLFYKKNLDPSPLADGKPCFEDNMWMY